MRIHMTTPGQTCATLLLLIGVASVVHAQPPGGRRGSFGGRLSVGLALARDEDVQQELGMLPKQVRMLEALQTDLVTQFRGRRRGGRDPQSGGDVTDKLLATVMDNFQLTRLRQLEVQFEGVYALERDRVAAALELSDRQKESIRAYSSSSETLPEDVHKLAVEVLSDEQLGKWNREIYGDAFRFSEDVQQFQRFIAGVRDRGARGPGRGFSD